MICVEPGCTRERARSSSGNVYTRCDDCIRHLTAAAFGVPVWVQRARAHQLPVRVEGGARA